MFLILVYLMFLIKLKAACMTGEPDTLMDHCNIIEALFKRSENLLLALLISIYNRHKDNITIYRYIASTHHRNCSCIHKKIQCCPTYSQPHLNQSHTLSSTLHFIFSLTCSLLLNNNSKHDKKPLCNTSIAK